MTRKVQHSATCPNCGAKVPTMTPFSDWLRSLEHPLNSQIISLHNLDYIWHNYRKHWLITIEEKRYGGQSTAAQRDTHGIVAQLLTIASGSMVSTYYRGRQSIEYRGHYIITFQNTTPDDSDWIKIEPYDVNNPPTKNRPIGIVTRIDKQGIIHLLTTGNLAQQRTGAVQVRLL